MKSNLITEMFGKIQQPKQNEKTPLYPRSPYGVAKQFAHSMTINYRESFGLHASSGILFNHESPLRGSEFVTKKITTQLAEIKNGRREKVFLGNLNAKRDWGYAKEYVEGMWLMLQQDKADDYVLATGKTVTVKEFVEYAAEVAGFQLNWEGSGSQEKGIDVNSGKVIIEVSKNFYRPAEVDVLLGDPTKAAEKLGWEASTSVKDLAKIMIDYDMNRSAK